MYAYHNDDKLVLFVFICVCIDVWTHWKCAVWASGVYFDGDELKGLSEAIEEGQSLVSLSLIFIHYYILFSHSLSLRFVVSVINLVLQSYVIFTLARDLIIILVLYKKVSIIIVYFTI